MSDAVIDPTVILARARSEALRLAKIQSWSPAFAGASPEAPILVARLDQIGRYFYLVSFAVGERATARLRMNAHTGAYAEGIGIDTSGGALPPYHTPRESYRRLTRVLQAEAKKKKKKNPKSVPAIAIEPFPAWRPCAQSFSAFLPFYLIKVGTSLRYVRFDGKVYDTLTWGAGL